MLSDFLRYFIYSSLQMMELTDNIQLIADAIKASNMVEVQVNLVFLCIEL